MRQGVDQVVVFDATRDSRELRYERTRRALERVGLGELEPKATGDRQECLNLLLEDENCRTLLLCDMLDDRDPAGVGNIGARMLRTVSHNRDLAGQVWRVLWSQHDHEGVIGGIAPYAHAFVWFDYHDRDSELLARAIPEVVGTPPVASAFHSYAPRERSAAQHRAQWLTTMRELLSDGRELKRNDDVAVAAILHGVPDTVANEKLAAARDAVPASERRRYCETVNELLDRVRGDKEHARRMVIEALAHMSQETVATKLTPQMVERAKALMQENPLPEELRYKTLLTESEDVLARTLVARYDAHYRRLGARPINKTTRFRALDAAAVDDEVQAIFDRPDLVDWAATPEGRAETMSYVICVYNDTARALGARAGQSDG